MGANMPDETPDGREHVQLPRLAGQSWGYTRSCEQTNRTNTDQYTISIYMALHGSNVGQT